LGVELEHHLTNPSFSKTALIDDKEMMTIDDETLFLVSRLFFLAYFMTSNVREVFNPVADRYFL
jgi:hypothetical protein